MTREKAEINFEELSKSWGKEFDALSLAGDVYDPRKWEGLWPGSPARWILKFLTSAAKASAESTCLNRHTGATLVDIKAQKNKALAPFEIISCFNGAPTGIIPCAVLRECQYKKEALKDFCKARNVNGQKGLSAELKEDFKKFKERYLWLCQAIHAEENTIYFLPRGENPRGKILFATTNPCPRCARMLVQNGIAAVVYSAPYKKDSEGHPRLSKETEKLFNEAKIPCVNISIPMNYYLWMTSEIAYAGKEIKDSND